MFHTLLVINPGSTSTKVAVYRDEQPLIVETLRHTREELRPFEQVSDQNIFRKKLILDWLERNDIPLYFDAIIGRGGVMKPIAGGVYRINRRMLHETYNARSRHASNLGCLLAYDLASMVPGECLALIADPITVDEMMPEARVTGSPLLPKVAIWHALNQRAIARRFARETGRRYEDLNLIVCHLGGGISVAAHRGGRAVDVNNALNGDGPFSPERAGTLPSAELIRLCFSGMFTEQQLLRRIAGEAGLVAHLGTTDIPAILRRIDEGDERARLVIDAMTLQISKSIASEAAVLSGRVDAVILTGGIAHSERIVRAVTERVSFLGPVHVYPGEDEMEALALNALAVLRGETEAKIYEGK